MHTYFLFIILVIFECFGAFLIVFLSLPLLLFTLVVSMAFKRKSTPSYNPLRSRASSFSDPTPLHLRFRDENARKDFSKNFSRWGVHLECRVILVDFADTDLPTIIHSRGWELLCDVSVTCLIVLIQEFYSNMCGFDFSVPLFSTCVRGTRIVVTPQLVADVLHVPRVEHPDYLVVSVWGLCLKTKGFSLSVNIPQIGVIVSLHHVRPLLKVLDSWTWWWLSFCTHSLAITLS